MIVTECQAFSKVELILITRQRIGLYSCIHIFCGLEGERGGECESERMRGHVCNSHASVLDCILYCTYSLDDGVKGGQVLE